MSNFTPTQWTLEPQARPDHLSAAVLHSLSRPVAGNVAWGPVKSFVLGGLTFGILPLLVWPKKFGRFVVAEQQQLWHLVEWVRIRTGDEEATQLRDSARSTGALPTLWIVPLVALVILAVNFIPWLNSFGMNPDHILRATYGFSDSQSDAIFTHHWLRGAHSYLYLYGIWNLCLAVGYVSHWLHVRQHAEDVHRLVRRLNLILSRQGLPPVGLYSPGIGVCPLWVAAGAIGAICGVWWAIPAAMAGAVNQRYMQRTSSRIRGELASRVQTLLQQQRPALNVPMPLGFRVICGNQLCSKPTPPGASFCPRCGSRLPPRLDAVA